MAYKFDENKYKKIFDNMYGSGSFESGLSQARDIGRKKTEAKIAKENYLAALKQKEKEAKERQKLEEKWTKEKQKFDQKKAEEGRKRYEKALKGELTAEDLEKLPADNWSATPVPKDYAKKKEKETETLEEPKKKTGSLDKLKNFITSKDTDGDGKKDGLLGLFEIIDRPADAIRTGIKEKVEGESFWKGAKDGFLGKKDTSGTDLNKSLGFDPETDKKDTVIANAIGKGLIDQLPGGKFVSPFLDKNLKTKVGKEAIGFASEEALDPLNLPIAGLISKGANLAKFPKGVKGLDVLKKAQTPKPSEGTLKALQAPSRASVNNNSNPLYDRLINKATSPKVEVLPENRTKTVATEEPKVLSRYDMDFNKAVDEQFEYLKNSMGKGVQPGGLVRDQEGYVTGAFGRVSNNPKWYQDFYKANNRKPTNAELRELAETHVSEGFSDEVGDIPAWRPKEVQEIDEQIDELNDLLNQSPEQEAAIRPILDALEEDKASILQQLKTPMKQEAPTQLEPSLNRLKAGVDYEPIESLKGNGGSLKRVTPEMDKTPIDINNPKEIVKRQINTSGKQEKSKFSLDKLMTQWVDDLRPLDKATKDLGGKNLDFDKNPYTQARLARGVAGKAEAYLKGGIYNDKGEKVGLSLKEIITPIEDKMDDFLAYITSKRTLDYSEKGLTAGIKPKDVEGFNDRQLADATIRQIEMESPEVKIVHEALIKYNNQLMDTLVDAEVLSKESVDAIRKENPNYIPMFRVQEPKVRGFEPLTNPKRTYANLGEPIKKRTGSQKEIINPLESIVKNTYLTLNIAERNKVGNSLLNLVENAGDNIWGRVLSSQKGLSVDDLGRSLDEANIQLNDGHSEAVDNLFKGQGNKVYVYKNGQKVEMELQEDLYKAMLSLDTQKQNFFINMLSVPTRMLRTGAVLSPDFGPVNIFRDQFSAFVNSKYGFKPFFDMFSGLSNVLKKDDVYWSWKNNGGANSVLSNLDREYLQQDLRKLIKEPLNSKIKRTISDPKSIPLKALNSALEPLRKVSEMTEEATRIGEFKKGLKKGASMKEAAFASRDLIDFNRAGNLGRQYNQVTAFFNAAVQSLDKTRRTFKENPVGATTRAVISVTLPSIVAYMYNKDKEWYKEIPQRERDLYWHFEIDGQVFKLPKPFEVGVLFGTVAERTLDFLATEDPAAFKDLDKTIKDTFTLPWLPTAAAPWIEVFANKSMYFDSPIVPRREQDLLPEDQYGPYQSELFKGLGKLTKTSPRLSEHVFKGYTGGLGKYFLMGTDTVAKVAGKGKPQLPDRGLADLPIINRFVVKNLEGNNQSVDDFYTRMDKLKREHLSSKKNSVNNPNESIYKSFNKLSRDISKLQSEKRAIIENPNMSGKQKTQEIKFLDKRITELAKKGNNLK